MNCQQIEQSLIAYLDTKAKPAERRRVEAHLAECAACTERAEQFRLLWGVLDELPTVAPQPEFDAAVRARVAREPRHAGFWASFVPSTRLVFSASALLACSLWLASFTPSYKPAASIAPVAQSSEADFGMIKNLPVLEDYDVLANFDALSELPADSANVQTGSTQPRM